MAPESDVPRQTASKNGFLVKEIDRLKKHKANLECNLVKLNEEVKRLREKKTSAWEKTQRAVEAADAKKRASNRKVM